jgi:uncharacterized membrane protein
MNDGIAVLLFWLSIEALGLAVWPVTRRVFEKFPDRGWAFSKLIGVALVAWPIWWLSHLHLVAYGRVTVLVTLVGLAALCWLVLRTKSQSLSGENRYWIIRLELLFLAGFGVWIYLRGFSPNINGLEKFEDYGFLLSALKSESMPPLDHFFARETINYYYYGHYLSSVIVQLAGIPPEKAFNLLMCNIAASVCTCAFSVGLFLAKRLFPNGISNRGAKMRLWATGLLSAFYVGIAGNLHTLVYLWMPGSQP